MDVPNGGGLTGYDMSQGRHDEEGDVGSGSGSGNGRTGLEGMKRREEVESPDPGPGAGAGGSVLFDAEQGQASGAGSTRMSNIDEEARIEGQEEGMAVDSTPPTSSRRKPGRKVSWGENRVFGETETDKSKGADQEVGGDAS